eukprot:4171080-Amphidinium_carterae.1
MEVHNLNIKWSKMRRLEEFTDNANAILKSTYQRPSRQLDIEVRCGKQLPFVRRNANTRK